MEEVVVDACKMPNMLLSVCKAEHIKQLHKVVQTAMKEG